MPGLALLNAWARDALLALPDGRALTFVESPRRSAALGYETRIAERAEIATRAGNLHDVCNALAWLLFPRTKSALNAVHVNASRAGMAAARGAARDAATLLDESGLLVACTDGELLERWRAHAWRDAFWERREEASLALRAVVIGHGMLAKCGAPFRAITAKALVVPLASAALPADSFELALALDVAAAARLNAFGARFAPRSLLPLPIAALPGWDTEHLGRRLFDDAAVFRPLRGGDPRLGALSTQPCS